VLTERARAETCWRVGEDTDSVAEVATALGVGWHTAMTAVVNHGQDKMDGSERIASATAIGGDETVFLHACRSRHTTYATGMVTWIDPSCWMCRPVGQGPCIGPDGCCSSGPERLSERGWARIQASPAAGDPPSEIDYDAPDLDAGADQDLRCRSPDASGVGHRARREPRRRLGSPWAGICHPASIVPHRRSTRDLYRR
jgi:hypothetical protein